MRVGQGWLDMNASSTIHNGDGLCYFDAGGILRGFRVNKVENGRIFIYDAAKEYESVQKDTILYRNQDIGFERLLSKDSASRRIPVVMELRDTPDGFSLNISDIDGITAVSQIAFDHQSARSPQEDNIRKQLSKLGDTIFEVSDISVAMSDNWFIPSSLLSDLRHMVVEELLSGRAASRENLERRDAVPGARYPAANITYSGNVMNAEARRFYNDHGVADVADAYELHHVDGAAIMFCRHCLRYAFGMCSRSGNHCGSAAPSYIKSADGRRFKLSFDCSRCVMIVSSCE